jgi:deoxycytidylate deaminase
MMLMTPDEDRSALAIAYHAARLAVDPRTQNGGYLVNDRDGVVRASIGHNMAVRGAEVEWDTENKYEVIHHAEEAAIHGAAVHGIATYGAFLYVPWYCCHRCARTIIGARVARVVGHRDLYEQSVKTNPSWINTITTGLQMLENAGIQCDWIEGPINAGPIRHAGHRWNPLTLEVEP